MRPDIRFTPPRRANRRIAGLVIPWILSRKTLRCLLAPPLPNPFPPLPRPDMLKFKLNEFGKMTCSSDCLRETESKTRFATSIYTVLALRKSVPFCPEIWDFFILSPTFCPRLSQNGAKLKVALQNDQFFAFFVIVQKIYVLAKNVLYTSSLQLFLHIFKKYNENSYAKIFGNLKKKLNFFCFIR